MQSLPWRNPARAEALQAAKVIYLSADTQLPGVGGLPRQIAIAEAEELCKKRRGAEGANLFSKLDYGTKAWVDAKKAFYVTGSKALGPMNDPNLPAFATREAADAHIKVQGGKVLLFGEVTREVIKSLAGGHNH